MWEPNSLVGDSNLVLLITKWSCRVSCCTRAKKLKAWNWLPFASNCGKWEAVFHDLVLWSSQIIEFNNKNDISSIKFKVANWFLSSDSQRQKFSVKKKKLSHGVLGLNVAVDHFHLYCNVYRTNLCLGKCLALNFSTTSALKSFIGT